MVARVVPALIVADHCLQVATISAAIAFAFTLVCEQAAKLITRRSLVNISWFHQKRNFGFVPTRLYTMFALIFSRVRRTATLEIEGDGIYRVGGKG